LRASHNLIHNHPHCPILFWGNDHLIEYNDIHHIALETGDVGAIYTGRDYSFRGNRIRYNYIHETGGVGMGSMGVYMDDCVSGTEVYGNVFYKVHWAMFIGGGCDSITGNDFKGIPPEGNVIAHNTCFGDWKEIAWFADEKIFDIRDNYVTEDLSRIGGPGTGFRFPENSPALKTGFKMIPFSQIGLQADEDRKQLKKMCRINNPYLNLK
jgi:hypothetical protein